MGLLEVRKVKEYNSPTTDWDFLEVRNVKKYTDPTTEWDCWR